MKCFNVCIQMVNCSFVSLQPHRAAGSLSMASKAPVSYALMPGYSPDGSARTVAEVESCWVTATEAVTTTANTRNIITAKKDFLI